MNNNINTTNTIDEEKLKAAKEQLACKILPPGSHHSKSGSSSSSATSQSPFGPDGKVKLTQMTTAGG